MAIALVQCYLLLLNPISVHPPQSLRLVDLQPHSGLSDSIRHNCQIASVLWRQRSLLNQLNRCQNTGRRTTRYCLIIKEKRRAARDANTRPFISKIKSFYWIIQEHQLKNLPQSSTHSQKYHPHHSSTKHSCFHQTG